ERDILNLEQGASQELLQGIFRAAHTLKGSSRAMGLTAMGELTHAMEDVLDQLRNDQLTVTPPLIDALFSGLDTIKVMLEEIAASGTTNVDTIKQTASLRAVLAGNASAPITKARRSAAAPVGGVPASTLLTPEKPAVSTVPEIAQNDLTNSETSAYQDAVANGFDVYGVRVELTADCVMKSVRAMMVLQALEHVGSILATVPNEEAL